MQAGDIILFKAGKSVFSKLIAWGTKSPYSHGEYELDNVINFLVYNLNHKYDYTGVIYLGFLKLLAKAKIPTQKMANTFQRDRDYFCSELVYASFYAGGIDIVPDLPDADVTSPADIASSSVTKKVEEVVSPK